MTNWEFRYISLPLMLSEKLVKVCSFTAHMDKMTTESPEDKAVKLLGYGYAQFNNDSVEKPFRNHFKLAGDLSGNKLSITDLIHLLLTKNTSPLSSVNVG